MYSTRRYRNCLSSPRVPVVVRVEKHGEEFHFPEVFQIDIDEEEYKQGKLLVSNALSEINNVYSMRCII